MSNPFDYLNAINYTKQNIMVDDLTEKGYNSFMVNRGLSYFNDTMSSLFEGACQSHYRCPGVRRGDGSARLVCYVSIRSQTEPN